MDEVKKFKDSCFYWFLFCIILLTILIGIIWGNSVGYKISITAHFILGMIFLLSFTLIIIAFRIFFFIVDIIEKKSKKD